MTELEVIGNFQENRPSGRGTPPLQKTTMSQRSNQITIGIALAVVATLGVSIAMCLVPSWRPSHQLARRWQSELPALDDGQVFYQLEKISQLGDPGIQQIVYSLASPRRIVVEGARKVLEAQFAQWQLQPTRQATPRLLRLAHRLARHTADLDKPEREWSANLAMQMLEWPAVLPVADRLELVKNCDTILRAAGSGQDPSSNMFSEASLPHRQPASGKLPELPAEMGIPLNLPDIPGGDLPLDIADIPTASPPDELRPRQYTPRYNPLDRHTSPSQRPSGTRRRRISRTGTAQSADCWAGTRAPTDAISNRQAALDRPALELGPAIKRISVRPK